MVYIEPNDSNSGTRRTGGNDGNHDALAGFAAALVSAAAYGLANSNFAMR